MRLPRSEPSYAEDSEEAEGGHGTLRSTAAEADREEEAREAKGKGCGPTEKKTSQLKCVKSILFFSLLCQFYKIMYI
jgi:hypothetical protein